MKEIVEGEGGKGKIFKKSKLQGKIEKHSERERERERDSWRFSIKINTETKQKEGK